MPARRLQKRPRSLSSGAFFCIRSTLFGVERIGIIHQLLHQEGVEQCFTAGPLLEIGGGTLESHQKNMAREMAAMGPELPL